MQIDRNSLSATVEDTDVLIMETDSGQVERDVQVYRDSAGQYHVLSNGVVRHPNSSAEDAMRALGGYLQAALHEKPNLVHRQMKAPPDNGPIKGETIARRMMSICGCAGQYDCNCVAVRNQAEQQLFGEHNLQRQAVPSHPS